LRPESLRGLVKIKQQKKKEGERGGIYFVLKHRMSEKEAPLLGLEGYNHGGRTRPLHFIATVC